MVFSQGDVVQVRFDPTLGHEPAKTRPAVVVSADDFNERCSMTAVVPITSTDNGYPMHVRIGGCESVYGWACVEQVRTLDLEARRCRKVDVVDARTMTSILDCIGGVFGI